MKKSGASQGQSASELISKKIAELRDWRGETLSRMRKLIRDADPDVVEEWKWMGTPVWSHDGIICTGESYKNIVKLSFAKRSPSTVLASRNLRRKRSPEAERHIRHPDEYWTHKQHDSQWLHEEHRAAGSTIYA